MYNSSSVKMYLEFDSKIFETVKKEELVYTKMFTLNTFLISIIAGICG